MNSVLDLQNLVQGFRLSCQTEGKSPKTIEWHRRQLMRKLCVESIAELVKYAISEGLTSVAYA